MNSLFRILCLPLGLIIKLIALSKEGSRDIVNRMRFKEAIIDSGCCIDNQSLIMGNVHLLEKTIINNSKIMPYSYVGKNCLVQNTSIGSFCSIANDVLIGLGKHPLHNFSTSTIFYKQVNTFSISLIGRDLPFNEYEPIEIGNDVWIGARTIILDGIKIGHGAVVAANSVVTKDVPAYAIVAGVPATIIKYRFSKDKIETLLNLNWWDWRLEKIVKEMVLNE